MRRYCQRGVVDRGGHCSSAEVRAGAPHGIIRGRGADGYFFRAANINNPPLSPLPYQATVAVDAPVPVDTPLLPTH